MANEIRISYTEMRAVAGDISTQAEQSRNVIQALENDVGRLLPTWEGASKDAFQLTFAGFKKELVKVPEMLEQVSLALRNTADRIELAEQQASGDITATITADN
jgi:WXG100 family type VII secretion target